MASTKEVKIEIMNVCHVSPQLDSVVDEFTLPLTFFDCLMLRSAPIERAYFFEVPDITSLEFKDCVVPRLKRSLSITISHFLPLVGNLVWPPQCEKPFIQYTPGNSVLLNVAESHDTTSSFDVLTTDDPREASHSCLLVPDLLKSDTMSSILALQVTLFPNKGFCIGITISHAVYDGRAASLFFRAWAHVCKCMHLQESDEHSLTPELTPVFNRDVLKIPSELDLVALNQWAFPCFGPRSLHVLHSRPSKGLMKATFKLTVADIDNIRDHILSSQNQEKLGKETHYLSKFVVVCSYVLSCYIPIVVGPSIAQRAYFVFGGDMRTRLEPPVPANYSGNCLGLPDILVIEGKDFEGEEKHLIAIVAEKISGEIKKIDDKMMESAKEWLPRRFGKARTPGVFVMVTESPRYDLYGADFGWGRPMKLDILSVGEGFIGLTDDRDRNGGVEVSMIMKEKEIEIFRSQFLMGLKFS